MSIKNKNKIEKSMFVLTINTNKEDESLKEKLKEATNGFCYNSEFFLEQNLALGKWDKPGTIITPDPNFLDKIIEAKFVGTMEKGTVNNIGIHVHVFIEIWHKTRIHFNRINVKRYFAEELGLAAVHCDIKHGRDYKHYMEQYVGKAPIV